MNNAKNLGYENTIFFIGYRVGYEFGILSTQGADVDETCLKSDRYSTLAPQEACSDEALLKYEINTIVSKVESEFDTKVIKTWLPAKDLEYNQCLFITLSNQDELEKKYEDLEYSIYEGVADILKNNAIIDMVAII